MAESTEPTKEELIKKLGSRSKDDLVSALGSKLTKEELTAVIASKLTKDDLVSLLGSRLKKDELVR
jgi:hypothetical protein